MADFDDFTVDDRIAGLKEELMKVDKERAEQMARQRLNLDFKVKDNKDEFFNWQDEFAPPSLKIEIQNKNEPLRSQWSSSDVSEKKKKALETLEKLSSELETESNLKQHEVINEKQGVVKKKKRTVRTVRTGRVTVEDEKAESDTDVKALVFILTSIFAVYVTIGLGNAYLKNL